MMTEAKLKDMHSFAYHNRYNITMPRQNKKCGCFHCLATFPASEVTEWIDMTETAICPKCGVDSVLPGGRWTPKVLKEMQQYWFNDGSWP